MGGTHHLFAGSIRVLDVLQRGYMRAMASVSPARVCPTVFGAVMRCSARDFVQRRIRFFRIFEHNLTYYTMQTLREGDTYVDLGANVGYHSLLASRHVGSSGKVIAVEADPITFASLQQNLLLNGTTNVVAKNVAATGERCRIRMQRDDPRNSGANTVVIAERDGDVDGLPFEEIVGNDLETIKFIKIDIEEAEAPILDAILHLLPQMRDDVVIATEVSAGSGRFIEQFRRAGFAVFALQNVYTIDYYLIRSYMKHFDEDRTVRLVPVDHYDPAHRDYVFERVVPSKRESVAWAYEAV